MSLDIEEHAHSRKPRSDRSSNFKCPDCDKGYLNDKEDKEYSVCQPMPNRFGGGSDNYTLEVHCDCGFHYWFHIRINNWNWLSIIEDQLIEPQK